MRRNPRWADGDFELIVSPAAARRLERVLSRPKLRGVDRQGPVEGLVTGLMEDGLLVEDPPADPGLTPDPGTDYLVVNNAPRLHPYSRPTIMRDGRCCAAGAGRPVGCPPLPIARAR